MHILLVLVGFIWYHSFIVRKDNDLYFAFFDSPLNVSHQKSSFGHDDGRKKGVEMIDESCRVSNEDGLKLFLNNIFEILLVHRWRNKPYYGRNNVRKCDDIYVMFYQSILVEMRHQKIWQSNFSFHHCSNTTKLRLRKTVPISENFAIFRNTQFSSDGFDVSILYFRQLLKLVYCLQKSLLRVWYVLINFCSIELFFDNFLKRPLLKYPK